MDFIAIKRAMEKRRFIDRQETNAFRLVDGAGDGLPDLIIDDFSGRWLVQTFSESIPTLGKDLGYHSLYWQPIAKGARTNPQHLAGESVEKPFSILESGLAFEIDFCAGLSPGLFLDQRLNRARLRTVAGGKKVLNTFSYTCGFGLAAAAGGASTLNVDLSLKYLDWGKRNYQLNQLDPDNHEFLAGDVFEWLRRFRKQQRKFDLIVLDPPTFSRDRKSKVFRVEHDYGRLAELASASLDRKGILLCCTNYRGLSSKDLLQILKTAIGGSFKASEGSMPPDFTGEEYLKSIWLQF
jgi:23S rRNA (cytosine1962-C5)-methyltransferase